MTAEPETEISLSDREAGSLELAQIGAPRFRANIATRFQLRTDVTFDSGDELVEGTQRP
jgi:hypothetical protein